MRPRRARRLLPLLACAPVLAWAGQPPTAEQAARQLERGRQLYVESTSPAGAEVVAVLGEGVEVAGAAVPCAGCHGRDGRGRPEGGVTPTDITWSRLSRPYGTLAPGGRRFPPYEAASLERSLVAGVDPAGNPLHAAMPRYRMSAEDMADLVAYLQTLGEEPSPGVSESAVRIGVLLPAAGPGAAAGEAMHAALAARAAELDRQGGRYGRRVELRFLVTPPAGGDRQPRLAERLAHEAVFAVLSVLPAGADEGVAEVCDAERIPLLLPFARRHDETAVSRYVFSLLPGGETLARALVRLGRETAGGAPRPVVLAPADSRFDVAVAAAQGAAAGWAEIAVRRYRPGQLTTAELARELAAIDADPVLFLGPGDDAVALLAAAVPLTWRPRLLAAGVAGPALLDAPAELEGRIFIALPAPPGLSAAASARYRQLATEAGLPGEHVAAQALALAAAEVLVEGLTRTGRNLTREGLVDAFEGLRRFDTGYLPPLSFGPSRRLGARGAYLARVDLKGRAFTPAGGWIDVP